MKIVNKSAFMMAQYHAGKFGTGTCTEQWNLAMLLLRKASGLEVVE